jgi:hypothetical protein
MRCPSSRKNARQELSGSTHPNKSAAPGTSYISIKIYFNEQQAHYTSEFEK